VTFLKRKVFANDASPSVALRRDQLDAILQFDTCTISDAIEQFGVRLRNEGFTRPGLRCFTPAATGLLGYAATFRVRSSDPPVTGGAFLDRTDWWEAVERLPLPRIAVVQDLEVHPVGSCVGAVHSAVLKSLHCHGIVTNGAVRDVPAVSKLDFQMFAPFVTVSHAYMHVIDFGKPVEILGLEVHWGDLLYADSHGAVSIPLSVAAEIAEVAREIRHKEERIVHACLTPGLPREELLKIIRSERE
jgi:4-hydroxy-4-methyl-2-oxoglutarate aldolase